MGIPSSRYIFGTVPWYSVLIVIGAAAAIFLADREAKRQGFPQDTVIDLALRVLPLGILGARLYYVLFSWPLFRDRPLSVLYIWEGGLAIYGGLLAGCLTVFFFCRRRRLSVRAVLDLLAPGVALAQALGRWGNYFNQEAYGLPVSSPALRFFPLAVPIPENGTLVWHVATFFLASVLDLALCLFLLYGRRRLFRQSGDCFLFYLLFYAAGRLFLERLRMDSLMLGGGIRVSQLLSVLACLLGLLLLAHRRRRRSAPWKAVQSVSLALALLAGLAVLCLSLGWAPAFLTEANPSLILLGAFSCLTICTALCLYLPVDPREVLHANH